MGCCCPYSNSASKFFSVFARRYRKRFQRRGFEASQQQLLVGLRQAGYVDASILEIGSGVGHLHQTLLEQGAARAVGIDLAPRMIEEAQQWARERQLDDRVQYLQGDFMELDHQLPIADVTVLDKVVCCYPDADGLVHRSLARTGRVYALTYPRDRWYVRAAVALAAASLRLVGSAFRPYVHDPGQIERWIEAAGFRKSYQNHTPIWLTQVFTNENVS